MDKEQMEARIRAAAWAYVAEIGWRETLDILDKISSEIKAAHWTAGSRTGT